MRSRDIVLGVFFATLCAAMLPALLVAFGQGEELHVRVRGPRAHAVLPSATSGLPVAEVLPTAVRGRLMGVGRADFEGPGLALRTWSLSYGHRWDREVYFPVLRGPFDALDAPGPCGIGLRLRASLFDRGAGQGNDLATAVSARLRDLFPRDVGVPPFALHFPAARSIDVRIAPAPGALDARYDIRLTDDTQFRGTVRVTFTEADGDLEAHPVVTAFDWTGGNRTDWRLRVVDLFSGVVDRTARRVAEQRITERVGDLMDRVMDRVRAPRTMGADRPGDRAELRFCGPPRIDATGMNLTLGLTMRLAAPLRDVSLAGPPHLDTPPRFDALPALAGDVEVIATPSLVQQALFVLWQSGRIDRWGRSPAAVRALEERAQDRLNFQVDAIDVTLPPAIVPESRPGTDGWRVRIADTRLGRASVGQIVRAHLDTRVRVIAQRGTLGVEGHFTDVRVDCIEPRMESDTTMLRPCLSDVVSALRGDPAITERRSWLLDASQLDRYLRVRMDGDVTLELRNLRVAMVGTPVAARVSADAIFGRIAP